MLVYFSSTGEAGGMSPVIIHTTAQPRRPTGACYTAFEDKLSCDRAEYGTAKAYMDVWTRNSDWNAEREARGQPCQVRGGGAGRV